MGVGVQSENWIITGGAGYIGSHIADLLLAEKKSILIYDSFYRGLRSRIEFLEDKYSCSIPVVKGDIRDFARIESVLSDFKITGIIHTAALKSVSESFEKPNEYIDVNFHATSGILKIAKKLGIKNFIFSSTAAVYGDPGTLIACQESDKPKPISPYGYSKLLAENCVTDFLSQSDNIGCSLRFFNVIGTSHLMLLDNSTDNLLPIVLKKLDEGKSPLIYGDDYPTQDGTCVRDYVDVRDIARAHLAIIQSKVKVPPILNIGTGKETSVKDIINLMIRINTGNQVEIIKSSRRAGDPAFLCADVSLVDNSLEFQAKYTLRESIESVIYTIRSIQ